MTNAKGDTMILKLQDGNSIQLKFKHHQNRGRRSTVVHGSHPLAGYEYATSLGVAVCHPNDPFCRATGRKIALARAIKHLDREIRTQIWKAYFEFVNNAGK